jgi:hypothetical protein
MKKLAIVQSNYIPWKGYFDMIASVDEFILLDDVQYTRRDWRNRNQIKTPQGVKWLTVPVKVKGKYLQSIRETEIDGVEWQGTHLKSIVQSYRTAPFFSEVVQILEPIYVSRGYTHLSPLNRDLTQTVCDYLGIATRVTDSRDYSVTEGKTERLVDLCIQAGASVYVSGPAAKAYLVEALFVQHGMSVEWFDYSGYPPYPQLWGEFVHGVSILDLLFNCGKDSPRYMRHVRG